MKQGRSEKGQEKFKIQIEKCKIKKKEMQDTRYT